MTQPKTSKASAKAAAAARGPEEAFDEAKQEVSEVRKLISLWHWLEADQEYRSVLATTNKESERLIAIHSEQRELIELKLSTLVPTTLTEVYCLLKFSIELSKEGGRFDGAEISMLGNVLRALHPVFRDEREAARKAA